MADAAITRSATHTTDPAPVKKKRNNARKPLADKNGETNNLSSVPPSPAKSVDPIAAKESNQPSPKAVKQTKASKKTKDVNQESQPSPKTAKQTKASKKTKEAVHESQPEKDLLEMQEKLDKLRLKKEKTEILKSKEEEELVARGKKQEKMDAELKKLQKLKKPTVNAHHSKGMAIVLQLTVREEAEAEAEAEREQGTEEPKAVGLRKSVRKKQVSVWLNDYE